MVLNVDWRKNAPTFWLLERPDEGHGMPVVVFESKNKNEVIAESGRLVKERPLSIFRIESRTER